MGSRRLAVDLNDGWPVWVEGDPRELEQVFVNLFTNARDASPEDGEVAAAWWKRAGRSAS